METERYSVAVQKYGVLKILSKEDKWYNINDLSRQLRTSNPTRLKQYLGDLVKRDMIQYWGNLTDDEKQVAKKQNDDIKRINNYKITSKGYDRFVKIKESCSEPSALKEI